MVAPTGIQTAPAVWREASPITAEDVKWSFDRAVSVGGFPTVQMKAGSLEKPEQFEAVDDKTFVALPCSEDLPTALFPCIRGRFGETQKLYATTATIMTTS